jgi:hypothetical protein
VAERIQFTNSEENLAQALEEHPSSAGEKTSYQPDQQEFEYPQAPLESWRLSEGLDDPV